MPLILINLAGINELQGNKEKLILTQHARTYTSDIATLDISCADYK